MLERLRRLLSRPAGKPKAASRHSGAPWYMRRDKEEVTPERIEAARQRLKETIPPPGSEEPGGEA